MKKSVLISLMALQVLCAPAQDMTGLVGSDYSGISRSFINPASFIHSRNYFEVLLLSGSIHAQNNYLFIPQEDYSILKLRTFDFPTYPETGQQFLDNYPAGNKYAYINMRITGPSAMLAVDRQSFAINQSFRSVTSVDRLPNDIAKFMLEGLNYGPQQNIRYTHNENYTIGSLSWAELGLSYSYMFFRENDANLSIGANIRRLWAYHGFILKSIHTDYMTPDSDVVNIYRLDGTVGLSGPVDYDNNEFIGIQDPVRGKGFAFDVGVVYTRTLMAQSSKQQRNICSYPYEPYLFRIGLSLMDFGDISFYQDVRHLVFDSINTTWTGLNSLEIVSVNHIIEEISTSFTDSPDALLQGTAFNIALPAYLSLQFDYNFQNNFLLNALVVHNIQLLNNAIPRPSYISIAPRYSTELFELSLPFLLYRYRHPHMGISFRYHHFAIGTDKLGGFLGLNDFDGIDFWFSIQYGILKGDCRRFGSIHDCPAFN